MGDNAVAFSFPTMTEFLTTLEDQLGAAVRDTVAAPLRSIDGSLEPVADLCLSAVNAGGKRLRPRFMFWAWRAARPADADLPPLVHLAAAVELLHAAVLVHDDVIDDSDVRRGQPSVRAALAACHRADDGTGDARLFGDHMALLVGDLLWSAAHDSADSAVGSIGTAARRSVRHTFGTMRVEVVAGQLLELQAQAGRDYSAAAAGKIQRYKTSSYTVERPVQLGLALAGTASPANTANLQEFARAVGRAFQLRDDLTDLFSTTAASGKRVGDDIRGGKPTELLGTALELANASDRHTLTGIVGDADADDAAIDSARRVLVRSGAVARIRSRVAELVAVATAAIEELSPDTDAAVRAGLTAMLTECTDLSFLPTPA